LDQETGLYYYRARYYDSSIGRFVSEDPIGFDGRDANLYRYVGNSPVNYIDPSGNGAAGAAIGGALGGVAGALGGTLALPGGGTIGGAAGLGAVGTVAGAAAGSLLEDIGKNLIESLPPGSSQLQSLELRNEDITRLKNILPDGTEQDPYISRNCSPAVSSYD
jgi:RHS repeat-associated protein